MKAKKTRTCIHGLIEFIQSQKIFWLVFAGGFALAVGFGLLLGDAPEVRMVLTRGQPETMMALDNKTARSAAERNPTEQGKVVDPLFTEKTSPQATQTLVESSSLGNVSGTEKTKSIAADSTDPLRNRGSGLHHSGESQSTFSDPSVGMGQTSSAQVNSVNLVAPAGKKQITFETSTAVRPLRSAPARLPLVFKSVDPIAVGLSDLDMRNIEILRESFEKEIGKQDGNDPNYRRRWTRAQSKVDEELRADLGWTLFSRYQIEASKAQ